MTPMLQHHPAQRTVPCRILTFAGWIEGSLHVMQKSTLLDHLGRGESLLRLTDAWLPGEHMPHPFFALQRASVIAIAPDNDVEPIDSTLSDKPVRRRISWLLSSGGVIEGTIALMEHVRVSDYLVHHDGFVPMEDCRIMLPPGARGRFDEVVTLLRLALQANRAIGVTEVEEK